MPYSQLRLLALLSTLVAAFCSATAPAQTIDECGTLVLDSGCVLFRPDTGGLLLLGSTAGFAAGDRIHVVGTLNTLCAPPCASATGCITATVIEACGTEFSGCGTLIQSGACVLFQSDSFGTFVLDDTGGFTIGARVEVTGMVNPNCTGNCLPSSGCIAVSTIAACGLQFSSCGLLVQRGACIAFTADQGGTFILDDLDGFEVGARVLVTGSLDVACMSVCEPVDGCIIHNTIDNCGTSFSGCGTLVQGPGCVLFQADTGTTFALSNFGIFVIGDRVNVTGTLGAPCISDCTEAHPCIANNTIEACAPTPPARVCPATAAALITLSIVGLYRARRAG